jgi:hypothetical protein
VSGTGHVRVAARRTLLAVAMLTLNAPAMVGAQTLVGQLSTLLTEQRASGDFTPDPAAARATLATVAGLFSVELTTLPTTASASGFVYRLSPSLGVFERASNDFGPFFTERALRNSRRQTSVGFTYQSSKFGSLQGADLTTGTFPTNAARNTGVIDPFSLDLLTLNLESRTATAFVSHGVTDRLTIGGLVPIVHLRFSGQRVRTIGGRSLLQSAQSGSTTGLGDVVVNARYQVAGGGPRGVTVGADWRLPTGREEDLLGVVDTAGRFLAIASWEEGQLSAHVNGGVGVGGASDEAFWNAAMTFSPVARVTVVGEFMGRYLSELTHVRDVYQPHPVMAGVETMRWLPADKGIHTMFVVTGAKWNLAESWLLNTNLLIRITDAGLRAKVTPAVSLDYAFGL